MFDEPPLSEMNRILFALISFWYQVRPFHHHIMIPSRTVDLRRHSEVCDGGGKAFVQGDTENRNLFLHHQ